MAKWKQNTTVEGGATYPELVIDSDKLLRMMAQATFERQAGGDFTLRAEVNEKYEIVTYIFIRKMPGKTVINRFDKIQDLS